MPSGPERALFLRLQHFLPEYSSPALVVLPLQDLDDLGREGRHDVLG